MEIGRRQFLLAGFAAAQESATPLLDRGFARVIRLAPGVYATIADPSKGSQCGSNGGIIAGRSAVLIVEGHMRPAGAALEIEAAGMVSEAPIRGAVNTHFHYDHTFGNESYAARQILVLAHEQVGPLMREQYAAVKGAVRAPLLAKFKGDDLEFAKKIAGENYAVFGNAYDEVCCRVPGMKFEERGQSAEVDPHGEFRGRERFGGIDNVRGVNGVIHGARAGLRAGHGAGSMRGFRPPARARRKDDARRGRG
jgi:hypothetical protein